MSSLFYASGPDPLAHLKQHTIQCDSPAFEGLWSTIEIQPNLFSPQKFVVGIAVAEVAGQWHFRLIGDGKKFDCVYGKVIASGIREILESVEQTLLRAQKTQVPLDRIEFECNNIIISPPWTTSGASPEQVLARLFSEVVVMEPVFERNPRDFVTLDTEEVRVLVSNELKRISGIRHEQIVVQSSEVVVEDEATGESHVLDFNLRTATGAGSVVSAVYKTPSTIELNLLRASRDLAIYSRARQIGNLALFIMTAKAESFEPSEQLRIGDLIDEQTWRMEKQGLRVVAFDNPPRLAESILEWAT